MIRKKQNSSVKKRKFADCLLLVLALHQPSQVSENTCFKKYLLVKNVSITVDRTT